MSLSQKVKDDLEWAARALVQARSEEYEEGWNPKQPDEMVTPPAVVAFTRSKADPETLEFSLMPEELVDKLFSSHEGKAALTEMIRGVLRDPEVAGVIAITEAWQALLEKDKPRPDGSIRDIPGSFTVLLVQVHTIEGTTIYQQRMTLGKRDGEIQVFTPENISGRMAIHDAEEKASESLN